MVSGVYWVVFVVLVNAAYLTSTDNIHHAELMSVVETLSRDTDRDVQYIISKQHDSWHTNRQSAPAA